ncbi:MAG: transporter substrate-binding domain-containing protein, partial [Inquilinus sp.]|nr:transporter substrate-binding domain-containing protein [Inquilinus sp.]
MRRLVAMAAAILAVALTAGAAQAQSRLQTIQERGTLRVGTTGDFNPMSILDPASNSYQGFDIEAMERLAADLG